MNIEEQYFAWAEESYRDIEKISHILSTPLSDEPEQLMREAKDIEAWNARALLMLAEANSYLEQVIAHHRKSLDDEGTVQDKKIALDNATSLVRKLRNMIEGLTDAIKQRLILSESCMAYMRSYNVSSGAGHEEKIY